MGALSHKSCYIFGAAPLGNIPDIKNEPGLVIAADAGFSSLKELNVSPHIVLGDFDSLGEIPRVDCELVRHPVEKDDTDMGLAVKEGLKRGCDRFFLFGGIGGERLDHTVANLQTLTSLAKQGISTFLTDGSTAITAISCGKRLVFHENYHGILSVFSADGICHGVTLKNLQYTLTDATLNADFPLGVSNAFVENAAHERGNSPKNAEISVKQGTLWVIFDCKGKSIGEYPEIF